MDEYAAGQAMNYSSGIINGPLTPYGGYVHQASVNFNRRDGHAGVNINGALTDAAALKLDAFLRELLAEDAPALRQLEEQRRAEAQAQQMRSVTEQRDMREKLRATLDALDRQERFQS